MPPLLLILLDVRALDVFWLQTGLERDRDDSMLVQTVTATSSDTIHSSHRFLGSIAYRPESGTAASCRWKYGLHEATGGSGRWFELSPSEPSSHATHYGLRSRSFGSLV